MLSGESVELGCIPRANLGDEEGIAVCTVHCVKSNCENVIKLVSTIQDDHEDA